MQALNGAVAGRNRTVMKRSRGRHVPSAPPVPAKRHLLRNVLASRRVLTVLLFTVPCAVVQGLLLLLPGAAKKDFARFYWLSVAHVIGLHIRIIGLPAEKPAGRPVIFVSNHSSWLDIPAIGGTLKACFVSKDDVAGWPIVGTVARLGRTVFVSRSRQAIGRERTLMHQRLAAGDDLILFPEGTSSDGSRVLPFHSSFFAAAYVTSGSDASQRPLIQPVSVVYDRLAGLPVGRASRAVFAWYGDMSLAPHVWRLAQWRGKRVTLLFHAPLDPADYPDRKALSQAAWTAVAEGAGALRQNRPARPLGAPVGGTAPEASTDQAFA
jgi:1-acyl-sn-glycerol-3-phosphate acyltransferase